MYVCMYVCMYVGIFALTVLTTTIRRYLVAKLAKYHSDREERANKEKQKAAEKEVPAADSDSGAKKVVKSVSKTD